MQKSKINPFDRLRSSTPRSLRLEEIDAGRSRSIKMINQNLKMGLTKEQMQKLKELMRNSARKGNLANSGIVLENGNTIAEAESLVVSNRDATAHSERMLVERVCKDKGTNYTPGLVMVTVCEPCLMCLSACSWAGYNAIAYIIPAEKYIQKIPWMAETMSIDKKEIVKRFTKPVELIHLSQYEQEFSEVFEKEMKSLLI